MVLEKELAAYGRELARLLEEGESGRFAVLHGDHDVSVWDTYRDALQYGYERFGDDPFMVHQIDPRDRERLPLLTQALARSCPS